MRKLVLVLMVFVFILATSSALYAHSGRTDSNGGHHDNSDGSYHYHSAGNFSAPPSEKLPTYPNNGIKLQ